jgi:putative membrane protein
MTGGGDKKVVIEETESVRVQSDVGNLPSYKVIVEEIDDTTPITVPDRPPPEFVESAHIPRGGNFLWKPIILIISGTLLICGSILVEWLIGLIKAHRIMAFPVGLGLAILVWGMTWLLIREIRSIYQLRNAEKFQSEIIKLSEANVPWSDAAAIVQLWKRGSDSLVESQLAKVISSMESHDRALKFFKKFENDVIRIMDDRAVIAIHNAARDIFFLTAVAPTVIVDTVIFTFRASFLVRQIAFSYGARPGPIARVRLIREALKNVAVISLTDIIVTDVVAAAGSAAGRLAKVGAVGAASLVDSSGALANATSEATGIVGDLTSRVAEDIALGLVSARRMALFGLLIVAACRPTGLKNERRAEMGTMLGKRLREFGRPTKST